MFLVAEPIFRKPGTPTLPTHELDLFGLTMICIISSFFLTCLNLSTDYKYQQNLPKIR